MSFIGITLITDDLTFTTFGTLDLLCVRECVIKCMHTCVSMQRNKIYISSLLSLSLQRNQVQSGSALKRSPPTPGRRACHLEWGCQGSGPGTPSLSGSRWPCSCKWQLRSPSTVQVRAYHGGHVFCGWVADKERRMGGSIVCRQCFVCVWERT